MALIALLRRLFGPVIGFSFAVVVFGTSIFGNYIVTLFLPMISVFNMHKLWREMMDRAISFWMVIPMVRVSGDSIDCREPAIIIMNHRTRLDWLYFWLALWRINPWLITTNKIALKELLRHVPGAGFGMQASQYIFLRRDLETDLQRLSRAVDYYSDIDRPYQILMFPEGTDKTDHTSRRSNEYAKKNGLKPLKHVLYPRTAGFIHLIKDDWRQSFVKIFGFFFWISVVCVWIYHLRFLHFAQVGFVFLVVNYFYIYICYGGIDHLIYGRWEKWRRKTNEKFPTTTTSIV